MDVFFIPGMNLKHTYRHLKFQNEIVSFMIDVFFRFVLVDNIMLNVIEDDPMNTVNDN